MHEDEMRSADIGEEEEVLLPSGWQEDKDFFDTASWSGGTEPLTSRPRRPQRRP